MQEQKIAALALLVSQSVLWSLACMHLPLPETFEERVRIYTIRLFGHTGMLAKKVRCHVICVCFIVDIEINENIHKVDLNWGSKNVAVVKELKEGLNLRPVVICG